MSYIFAIVFAGLFLVADQISKFLVVANFELTESIPVISGLLNFTYIHNTGAAFGILKDQTWIFLGIAIAVMVICICMLVKKTYDSKLMVWAIMLVLAGGLGNMIDRIFRGGNVIDFIELDFMTFPIFNIADCAVTIGAGLIIVYFIADLIKEIHNKKESPLTVDDAKESECELKE